MIAIDTNLLVYAHRAATPEHRSARKAIEAAAATSRGWGIASSCLAEFWSVVTHPASTGGPSSAGQAKGFLTQLVSAGCRIWLPESDFSVRLLETASAMRVQGVRIFDLQIALLALANGATEIWTHDEDFLKIRGLKVYDPL